MADLPPIGSIVDRRYRVRREIARGAVGIVYEAEQAYLSRLVALKILSPEHRRVEDSQARLVYEGQALNAARHPGIVDALDAGVDETYGHYLVTELLPGRTLEGVLTARRKLGVSETRSVGLRLCDSLGYAHSKGIIHRDIKPGNVFIARFEGGREFIKLFDFGIARSLRPGSRKLTAHGMVMGTPEYMSPEQLHAREEIDERSDIYALGVTLFECVTGTVPYEGHYADVLMKSATEPLPAIRGLNPDVPPEFAKAIETALRTSPSERHQSMREFAESLARGQAGESFTLLSNRAAQSRSSERGPAAQRRYARAPYVTPVRVLRPDGSSIDGRSEDISVGGLLTVLTASCAAGEVVRVRFALPIVGKIGELEASTRWIRTARGKDAVGLEFRTITAEARDAIERYVSAMGGG